MAARKWSPEQRAAQSAKIHNWKPWQHSTGAKSLEGKAIVSRNAYCGGKRQLVRFSRWVFWALKHPETLPPEIVEAAQYRSIELCRGFTEYLSEIEAKLTATYK